MLAVAAFILGCGDAESPNDNAQPMMQVVCAKPDGLYKSHWERQGGSCPQVTDGVVNPSNGYPAFGTLQDGCIGTVSPSADGCSYSFDQECTAPFSYILRGKVTWNADASVGSGLIYTSSVSAIGVCSSNFMVYYTRL